MQAARWFTQRWSLEAVPVNKVGGTVDGVDDPRGIVSENAGGACCYRLLTYEASKSQKKGI